MTDVVLISPPVAKACEPLLGIATLKAFLEERGVSCACIDANVEAQEWLLQRDRVDDAVGRLSNRPGLPRRVTGLLKSWPHLAPRLERLKRSLRTPHGYRSFGRYKTAVTSLNRVMGLVAAAHDADDGSPVTASLTDYLDERVCDMSSASVREASLDPARNLFYEYFARELIPRVVAMRPKVVGLSLIFRNQLLCGFVLAAMLREALPDAHVTVGGELVSAWAEHMEDTGLCSLADSIIPYEGELPLLALGQGARLEDVPNVCWLDGDGRFRRNPTRKVASMADVPAPDYSWAPWDLYFAPERIAPMVTARGCYWNRCTFCPEVINPEAKLRLSRTPDLIAQVEHVHERYGATLFHFIDSALPPRTMAGLAEHVAREGRPYRWYGFSRLEPTLFREGFAETLARGGCRMLKLGLETASQRLLDAMDKKQDVGDVSRVLRALRDARILVHAYLMFGSPHETEADAELTRRFVADHADCVQFMNCSLMNLAKGSPMAVDPPAHGIRDVEPFEIDGHVLDLALYDNFTATGWGRLGARRYLHKVFLRDPRIRPAHLRTPPHFDANHSPLLHPLIFGDGAELAQTG